MPIFINKLISGVIHVTLPSETLEGHSYTRVTYLNPSTNEEFTQDFDIFGEISAQDLEFDASSATPRSISTRTATRGLQARPAAAEPEEPEEPSVPNIPMIVEIDAGNTVTSIAYGGFAGCSYLQKVSFPYVTEIGGFAFIGCTLTYVDFPRAITMGESAFGVGESEDGGVTWQRGNSEVSARAINTNPLRIICEYAPLAQPYTYHFNFPELRTIEKYAFDGCSEMGSSIMQFPKVTTVEEGAFFECTGLSDTFSLPSATTIGDGAFWNCDNIDTLSLPNATEIGYAIFGARNTTVALEVPMMSEEKVESEAYGKWNIKAGSTITCGSGDVAMEAPEGFDAFIYTQDMCIDSLNRDYQPGTLDYMYVISNEEDNGYGNYVLKDEYRNVVDYRARAVHDETFPYLKFTNILTLELPNVIKVYSNSFEGCKDMTSAKLESATAIYDCAFKDCASLTSFEAPSAKTIEYNAFDGCTSLRTLDLRSISKYEVRCCIGYWGLPTHDGNNQLIAYTVKTSDYPNGTTVTAILGNECFSYGWADTPDGDVSRIISEFNYSGAESGRDIWSATTRELVEDYAQGVGQGAFDNHDYNNNPEGYLNISPTVVNLPNALYIGGYAFEFCLDIQSVSLPKVKYIESYAFAGCSQFEGLTFQSATKVMPFAFAGCDNLVVLNLPSMSKYDLQMKVPVNIGGSEWSPTYEYVPLIHALGLSDDCQVVCSDGTLWVGTPPVEPVAGTEPNPALAYDRRYLVTGPAHDEDYCNMTEVSDDGDTWEVWTLKNKDIVDPYGRGVYTVAFDNSDYTTKSLGPNVSPTSVSMANALEIHDFAFSYCGDLASVSFPLVESVGINAFEACTSLTVVSLPSATTVDSGAFKDCTSLATLSLPLATMFGSKPFNGCSSLVELDLSSVTAADVHSNAKRWGIPVGCEVVCSDDTITITQADYESNSEPLPYFTYDDETQFITGLVQDESVNDYDEGRWILKEGNRDIVDEYALGVETEALVYQPITSISLPNAVCIQPTAFQGCSQLLTVTIPSSMQYIGCDAFWQCTSVTDIYCFADPDDLTWIDGYGDDFQSGESTKCHVPAEYLAAYEDKFHTNATGEDETSTYLNATFVGDLVVPVPPVPGTSPLPQFEYNSAYQISGLTEDSDINDSGSIDVGPSESATVWALKSANKAVYDEYARGIADVEFGQYGPDFSAPFMDGWHMMANQGPSKSPTSVSLPNATYIGSGSLSYCANLASVNLPSVTHIGQQAFTDDPTLTSISLPSSIVSVGDEAFMNCPNLTSVTIAKTTAQVEAMNYENWGLGMVLEYDQEKYGDTWGHLVFDHEVTIHCTDGDIVVEEPAPPIEVEPETPDQP